jgi:TRAP-type C4-dicarboxylate transport system substrate-binding protein
VYDTADRLDRQLLAQLTASGIQVNESDRAAFLEASRAIYQEFAKSVAGGGALIASATALGGR